MEQRVTLVPEKSVAFICPFCQLHVEAGEDTTGEACVIHKEPICERFDVMDPLDFLTLARQTMQAAQGVENAEEVPEG